MAKKVFRSVLAVCVIAAVLVGCDTGSFSFVSQRETLREELSGTLEELARKNQELENAERRMETLRDEMRALEDDAYEGQLRRSVETNHTITVHSYDTSGRPDFQFAIYEPNGLDAAEPHPMVVYLHGSGIVGKTPEELLAENSLPSFLQEGLLCPNALVLIPLCKSGNWSGCCEDLMELIEYAADTYNADRSRISITGFSLGGIGCFAMLTHYPRYFSAAAPFAAAYTPAACAVITSTPVRMIHGSADTAMGFDVVEINEIIRNAGGQSELILFSGEGHTVQSHYLDDGGRILDWLTAQRRS